MYSRIPHHSLLACVNQPTALVTSKNYHTFVTANITVNRIMTRQLEGNMGKYAEELKEDVERGFPWPQYSHEICHLLWNLKVHYQVHYSPSLTLILSHMNPVYILPSYLLRSILMLSVS